MKKWGRCSNFREGEKNGQVTVGSITFYVYGRQRTLQNIQTEKDTRMRVLMSKHQANYISRTIINAKSHFSGLPPYLT